MDDYARGVAEEDKSDRGRPFFARRKIKFGWGPQFNYRSVTCEAYQAYAYKCSHQGRGSLTGNQTSEYIDAKGEAGIKVPRCQP